MTKTSGLAFGLMLGLILITGTVPAVAGCKACTCSCDQQPCGCWCIAATGDCECFQCGPVPPGPAGADLSLDLSLVQLRQGGLSACIPLHQSIQSLSRRMTGTPVFFGERSMVGFLSSQALEDGIFSPNLHLGADLRLNFDGLPTESAILMVAQAARLDLVAPSGLSGTISGQLLDVDWRQAIAFIAREAGIELHPIVSASGLVHFSD